MAADRHPGFDKMQFLTSQAVPAYNFDYVRQIWWKSVQPFWNNSSSIKLNMAVSRYLEFLKNVISDDVNHSDWQF